MKFAINPLIKARQRTGLIQSSLRLSQPLTKSEDGYSMAMVLILVLTVILGSVAIASRSTSGLLGIALSSKNRDAREAAETGMTEIISELNKEQNRALLIANKAYTSWSSSDTNGCTLYNANGTLTGNPALSPTSRAISTFTSTSNPVTIDNSRQFRITNISYTDLSRSPYTTGPSGSLENTRKGNQKGLLRLSVEGLALNASGDVVSRATITRDFEIVPKCCKRSFSNTTGKDWGRDTRPCLSTGGGGTIGILVGLGSNPTINTSNNVLDIRDESGNNVTTALCLQGTSACDNDTLGNIGRNVDIVPVALDPAPAVPTYPGSITTKGTITTSNNSRYIRVNTSGTVQICQSNATNCSSLTMCEQVTDAVTSVVSHWCRLREIDNSNKDLIIDSTNSPGGIRFYFDDTNTGDVIDLGGNGTIQHVRCTAPLADNGGACGTNATLANFDKLLLFATGNKTVNIKGTGGLSMGILAPAGTVEILRNSTFLGVTQSNNFRANGNVTIRVPNSSSNAIGNGFGSFPVEAYDWVARGIRYSSNY